MQTRDITISELIASELCIEEQDGTLVFETVDEVLRGGGHIALSFADVSMLTTPFIRALLGTRAEDFLSALSHRNSQLELVEISLAQGARIAFVAEDLALRARDPEAYSQARQRALETA